MLEWEIAEAEGAALPVEEAEPKRRQRYGWQVVLMVLGFAVATTGLVRWQSAEREAQLRMDLTRVIEGEARVLALGLEEQVRSYVDPDAPQVWRERYLSYGSRYLEGLGFPELSTVQLKDEGQVARVEVVWGDRAAQQRVEPRAYRLVNGTWRRTPYVVAEGEEVSTGHIAVHGPSEEVAALTTGSTIDLEGLRQRIGAHWPATWFNESDVVIYIVPEEFGPLLTPTNERNLVQINSAAFSPMDSASLLPADAQYRLALVEQVLYRLIRAPSALPISDEPILHRQTLFYHLVFAEARLTALTDEERTAIRMGWHEQLGGGWASPFQGPLFWDFGATEAEDAARQRRQVALHLLLEYLVERDGPEVLGRLASEMAKFHPTVFDLEAVFVAATGQSLAALEDEARQYVLNGEEQTQ